MQDSADVIVVGSGPAGSAAAYYAASSGYSVILIDAAEFPRDKTCGDGLTPRAIQALQDMGLARSITARYSNKGLKLHGFGGSVTAPWPQGAYPAQGSAMRRRQLDDLLRRHACNAGAIFRQAKAVDLQDALILEDGSQLRGRFYLIADGVRSPLGKKLGRVWHQEQVYGIAARSYVATPRSQEQWIHSHLELVDEQGTTQPGYGWVFPLGDGTVNLGCGALSTRRRPAKVNTKKLLHHYASTIREEWELGEPQEVASALLPMGGAISGVAGPTWMLLGDAAAMVNPLNGEGIDYALETARLAVELLGEEEDFTRAWPARLREEYGAAFTLARQAAKLLTFPKMLGALGPVAMRGKLGGALMPAAARLMGNLVSPEDEDLISRAWQMAGRGLAALQSDRQLWG